MQTNLSGLFTRGGAIFAAILFNAFLILQKQHSYSMYRPSAFHIAQVVTDIPLTIVQVFLFSIVVYFMFGLQYEAGKFFIFCFTLIGATLATTNMFRAFGNLSPSLYFQTLEFSDSDPCQPLEDYQPIDVLQHNDKTGSDLNTIRFLEIKV
ncbi:hypothetical protein ACTFIW_010717 [Dictyostelium discoideum]